MSENRVLALGSGIPLVPEAIFSLRFDTFEEAIADVRRRRNDWRYVILELWTIVWPEPKVK